MNTSPVGQPGGRRTGEATVSLIGIVDDDEAVRDSLGMLLESAGYKCAVFPSAEAFLASGTLDQTDCMVLDVRMPGMSGPELQCKIRESNSAVPVIFVTAQADEELRTRAMRDGAIAFLKKPFSDEDLLDAIRTVLDPHVN
jgi:FixJ family two-component response regulator